MSTDSNARSPAVATYTPQVFDVRDVDEARRIILTAEAGTTTDARWALETPYLADRMLECFQIDTRHVVLDYGCGLGRLAKILIERTECYVLGVDVSASMRQLAPGYVGSPRFAVVAPPLLDVLVARGLRVDLAIAVWVIQHAARPAQDIARIKDALRHQGGVFVANNIARAVPTDCGWVHDGIDVEALLNAQFTPRWRGRLPSEIGGAVLPDASFLAAYGRE